MKKILLVLLAALMLFSFAACDSAAQGGSGADGEFSNDTVVATVNGEPVYYGYYQSYLDSSYMSYFSNYYDTLSSYYGVDLLDEASATETLGDMEDYCWDVVLQSVIIKQMAEEDYGITFDETKYGWLNNMLSDAYYTMMESNLLYSEMGEAAMAKLQEEATTSEEEAKAAYDADPTAWNGRSSTHILITCDVNDAAATAAALATAQEIIAKLDAGATFESIVTDYPDLTTDTFGTMSADGTLLDGSGNLIAEYCDALFALEAEGDYTKTPVLSDYGYHIIRLDGIADSYEDVADQVTASLSEVTSDDVNTFLSDQIEARMSAADIQVKEDVFRYYVEDAAEGDAAEGDVAEGDAAEGDAAETEPAAE